MKFYRENTGIVTEQNDNCDYFSLAHIGIDLFTNEVKALLKFWEHEKNVNIEKPNQVRILTFSKGVNDTVESGINAILSFEGFPTDEGEALNLSNATPLV